MGVFQEAKRAFTARAPGRSMMFSYVLYSSCNMVTYSPTFCFLATSRQCSKLWLGVVFVHISGGCCTGSFSRQVWRETGWPTFLWRAQVCACWQISLSVTPSYSLYQTIGSNLEHIFGKILLNISITVFFLILMLFIYFCQCKFSFHVSRLSLENKVVRCVSMTALFFTILLLFHNKWGLYRTNSTSCLFAGIAVIWCGLSVFYRFDWF